MQRRMTRATFIVWFLAGLMTALVVIVIIPILLFIYPPAGKNKKQDVKVTLQKALSDLQDGEATGFDAPPQTGFLMVNGGGDNYPGKIGFKGYAIKLGSDITVLSSTCSHLGCSIQLDTGGKKGFSCPCHGSQFALDGKVTHGPAVASLSNYAWKLGDNASTIVLQGISLPGVG